MTYLTRFWNWLAGLVRWLLAWDDTSAPPVPVGFQFIGRVKEMADLWRYRFGVEPSTAKDLARRIVEVTETKAGEEEPSVTEVVYEDNVTEVSIVVSEGSHVSARMADEDTAVPTNRSEFTEPLTFDVVDDQSPEVPGGFQFLGREEITDVAPENPPV